MLPWALNILLPGTGLILCRREWLGVALVLLFGICANLALAGWLIAPAAVPTWLIWLGVGIAVLSWTASQVLLSRQRLLLQHCAAGLDAILRQARSALDAGDLDAARFALESGAALDDENVDLHVVYVRLCTLEGDEHGRRAAWHKVLRLDRHGRYRDEARRALAESSRPPKSP
jgi:hypothetical protein